MPFLNLGSWLWRLFGGGGSGGAGASASFESVDPIHHPNVKAGLQVVRACEGTLPPVAYRALYGYHPVTRPDRLFDSFADHPRRRFWFDGSPVPQGVVPKPYSYTTAAGAYQFTETTWDRLAKKLGRVPFDPASQDARAVELIRERGALDDLIAGRLEVFVEKCSPVWASLPFSNSGQPKRSMEFVRKAYRFAGGKEE